MNTCPSASCSGDSTFITDQGAPRRVGYEIEFNGVPILSACALVQRIFGGRIEEQSTFECRVTDTRYGDFAIEIDTSFLKSKKYEPFLEALGFDLREVNTEPLEKKLRGLFAAVIPFEVSTPPLPLAALDEMDALREALRVAGAKGTRASLLYAFGLHLNIETPNKRVETILAYLRSFILLYPWIAKRVSVDFTRRMSPYITPFSDEYADLILAARYTPSMERFIDDYLTHNPTRNRALDLLPLLADVARTRVAETIRDLHLIKPRPAFHYRLPNCLIDDATWSLRWEWETWWEVERLAHDRAVRTELARRFRRASRRSVKPFFDHWSREIAHMTRREG